VACSTVSQPVPKTPNVPSGVILAEPEQDPKPAPVIKTPPAPAPPPPVEAPAPIPEIPTYQSPLKDLKFWNETNPIAALKAFRRSCMAWLDVDPTEPLSPHLPEYGLYGDWENACGLASLIGNTPSEARQFFENQFAPVPLSAQNRESGLLTAYYQPEIDVRRIPNLEFSEPILAVPKLKSDQNLPRAKISPKTARVIAYGRPLEVFFMQIQGSGHIRFKNGRILRAAYAANNGRPYRSIGSVLIERGETTKDRSSKHDIESWMRKAGPKAARALMNENTRYIFFKEQKIKAGEGPVGAMRVPLTANGSVAVDPRYHPYGSLIWVETKLPQAPRDYKGTLSGRLVVAQDTGKAIRGAMRGDLYFGSGDAVGALAGVMKHPSKWTIFLPRPLAERLLRERGSS